MKYRATVNLWRTGVQDNIIAGRMKLQSGQLVSLGEVTTTPGRFVGVSPAGVIHVAHWQGSRKATMELYLAKKAAFEGKHHAS